MASKIVFDTVAFSRSFLQPRTFQRVGCCFCSILNPATFFYIVDPKHDSVLWGSILHQNSLYSHQCKNHNIIWITYKNIGVLCSLQFNTWRLNISLFTIAREQKMRRLEIVVCDNALLSCWTYNIILLFYFHNKWNVYKEECLLVVFT